MANLLKIYNTRKFVEAVTNGNFTTFNEHRHAVLTGPLSRSIVVCDEGVHSIIGKADTIEIDIVAASDDPHSFAIFPDARLSFTLDELVAGTEVMDEVALGSFVRKFGTRLEQNYAILLNSISEIGLNPEDYPRN